MYTPYTHTPSLAVYHLSAHRGIRILVEFCTVCHPFCGPLCRFAYFSWILFAKEDTPASFHPPPLLSRPLHALRYEVGIDHIELCVNTSTNIHTYIREYLRIELSCLWRSLTLIPFPRTGSQLFPPYGLRKPQQSCVQFVVSVKPLHTLLFQLFPVCQSGMVYAAQPTPSLAA